LEKLENIDTKLLRVFDEIRRTGSVSAAAERMGMSQSTMSFFLAKLRELFDDPLFVRTTSGMEPTARALELEGRVTAALAAVHRRCSNLRSSCRRRPTASSGCA